MKVILRESIENLGEIGDIVTVSNGYARNFLIPRRLGEPASHQSISAVEYQQRLLEKKKVAQRQSGMDLAKKIEEFSLSISRKVGKNDKLFGSVTSHDIAERLVAGGIAVNKGMIQLEESIKDLGVHSVSVKMHGSVVATLKVWVVKEEEN